SLSLIQSGTFRVLAKFDPRPFPPVPDVPLITTAVPGLDEITVWLGLVAPRGTPGEIIDKLQREVAKALVDPAIKAKADAPGLYPVPHDARRVCGFHSQGSRPMGYRREGIGNEIRLTHEHSGTGRPEGKQPRLGSADDLGRPRLFPPPRAATDAALSLDRLLP